MSRHPATALTGIHAITYALFDTNERLDRALMRRQVELCLASGVAGMAALGLATEVSKLAHDERLALMDWMAEDVGGRVPLGFTIFGTSVAEQVAQVRYAERAGADWVILQPPPVGTFGAQEYLDFFGRVADTAGIPVAIQNAPAFLGRGLNADEIRTLTERHPNIRLIKGEGPVTDIAGLIARTDGRLPVFNGRGGLELIDNFRIGCAGMLLAPDLVDISVRAWAAAQAGDEAGAEADYARMLPAAVFIMQGIEYLMCYGKRLFAARAGMVVHDRAPAMRPTATGLAMVERFARQLGPLPGA
jgi:4-hydroxy-tetrahydrodipicolinate synthase